MKKILLAILNLLIFSQAITTVLQAATTSATLSLEANIITSDLFPPSKPAPLYPQAQNHLCNPLVVFSWQEATDESGIAHYHFQLQGKLKKTDGTFPAVADFVFSRQITGSSETADYRVWQQGEIFYLQLKTPLAEGKYTWAISAQDTSGNNSPLDPNDWLAFDYLPSLHCPTPVICGPQTMSKVELSFGGQTVNNYNPNLTITYAPNQQPQTLVSLTVDNQLVAENIALINQQNQDFSVNHQLEKRQIVVQFARPYLKEKNDQQPYQIKIELKDALGCSKKFTIALNFSLPAPGNICQTHGTIAQLISPDNNMIVTEPDDLNLLFIWDICAPLKDITQTTFIYNGNYLLSLAPHTVSTQVYDFNISPLGIGQCGQQLTRFELKFKKRQFVLNGQTVNLSYNDPLNQSDYHQWSVSVLDCSGTTVNSAIARIRRLPGNLGTYFFCSNTAQCQQGTLADCLKSGKNCYFHDQAGCLANATIDCGANPPVKTYFWCDSEQTCTKGLLSTCSRMGKNCYLWETDPHGNDFGCLNRAAFECSREKARYQWCELDNTCRLGTLSECIASGQFCYRQEMGQTICPQTGRLNCFSGLGLVAQQQFPTPTVATAKTIDWLAWLTINIIPLLPYFLLPLGLLFIFFPQKVGLVFHQQTGQPIKAAQIIATRSGIYAGAALTNRLGMYFGFRLKEGEYQLFASHLNYLFPASKATSLTTNKWYFGESFALKHRGKKIITHLIPLDADPLNPPFKLKQSRLAGILPKLLSIINALQFLWGLGFALAIIAALISPTLINLLVCFLFTLSLMRRLLLSRFKVNMSGGIINENSQTTQMTPIKITLDKNDKLVLSAFTDNNGAFGYFLDKKLSYRLSIPGFFLVTDKGNLPYLPLNFEKKHLNLDLVIISQQSLNE